MKNTAAMRDETPEEIGGVKVTAWRDYLANQRKVLATKEIEPTGLPESDVLYYEMEDGSSVIVRPSGTEPKVKLYLLVKGESAAAADALLERYEAAMRKILK